MGSLKRALFTVLVVVVVASLGSCDKNELDAVHESDSRSVVVQEQETVDLRSNGSQVVTVTPTGANFYLWVERSIVATFVNVGNRPITLTISTTFAGGSGSTQVVLQPRQEHRVSQFGVNGDFNARYQTDGGTSSMTISWTAR